MVVRRLSEVDGDEIERVGGKAASLGELIGAGLPVPEGFVVTVDAYRAVIESAALDGEVVAAEGDTAEERVAERLHEADLPDYVREEILGAYDDLAAAAGTEEPPVAVRSSATAEDLPEASFAGQQETFLNVTRGDLLDRVIDCWASLFTERAISYREEQGFAEGEVAMAVVVQRMVDADRSGVLFTRHPSTGEAEMIVEAAWGLGEGVVSGEVSPDNYVLDRDGRVEDVTVANKKRMYVRDPETGETAVEDVREERRTERVLDEDDLERLAEIGRRVEEHYGAPQDVEWAMVDGEIYLLQSRPITTIEGGESDESAKEGTGEELVVSGLGASPGTGSGSARVLDRLDELDKVEEGDVIVTRMTTPDMVPAMQRATAVVTDEGGLTSHAAIISRELGVPAVTGTEEATDALADGQVVTVDGNRGVVLEGGGEEPADEADTSREREAVEEMRPETPVKPMTATEVKVNVSIPAAAERAAATGADGVGLLRLEHMVLETGKTPARYIEDHGAEAYVDELVRGIRTVADEFYPRPVRVRTLDAPTDEFRDLAGGEDEPEEHNPMLGFRGIRRSLDEPELFEHELRAFRRLYEMDYDNVELMFPLVADAGDVTRARELMREVGIDPEKRPWGVMVETPASALVIEDIVETGIDFASFGTNDLTQYTLAVDRNNERVAGRFDATHPAVLSLIERVIETCRVHDVETSICGEAGSDPEMVEFLVETGVRSISANIDAVRDVQHEVKRTEQRLLLDSVR